MKPPASRPAAAIAATSKAEGMVRLWERVRNMAEGFLVDCGERGIRHSGAGDHGGPRTAAGSSTRADGKWFPTGFSTLTTACHSDWSSSNWRVISAATPLRRGTTEPSRVAGAPAISQPSALQGQVDHRRAWADTGGGAWCVSRRGYSPPSDTPRGLFPNSLMSTGTQNGEGSCRRSAACDRRTRHSAGLCPPSDPATG